MIHYITSDHEFRNILPVWYYGSERTPYLGTHRLRTTFFDIFEQFHHGRKSKKYINVYFYEQ